MAIVHEAVCDECGVREKALLASLRGQNEWVIPEGWVQAAVIARASGVVGDGELPQLCSWDCVVDYATRRRRLAPAPEAAGR